MNRKSKQDLWIMIKSYNFNHMVEPGVADRVNEMFGGENASKRAFVSKLSNKLRWPTNFAKKALIEYKKFVYLGVTADFSVTPSKVIDQVWHEHLLFSRAYRDFCTYILGTDFDHNPELVPEEGQTGIFSAQYLQTLKLYKKEFGVEAPEDIWGMTKFDSDKLDDADEYKPRKKNDPETFADAGTPLWMLFGDEAQNNALHPEFIEYGGGSFGGAGSSGSWEADSQDLNSQSYPEPVSVDVSVSDTTSSDSGASGCSSSCGGGGD